MGIHIFDYTWMDRIVAAMVKANYAYGAGTNLLDGKPVARGAALALGPWDLAIVEE